MADEIENEIIVNPIDNEEEMLHGDEVAAVEKEEFEGIKTDNPALALEFEEMD